MKVLAGIFVIALMIVLITLGFGATYLSCLDDDDLEGEVDFPDDFEQTE